MSSGSQVAVNSSLFMGTIIIASENMRKDLICIQWSNRPAAKALAKALSIERRYKVVRNTGKLLINYANDVRMLKF